MKLWHYTGSEHVVGIQRRGIHGGALVWPTPRGYTKLADLQWLTDSDSWQQGWATQRIVRCDRTEARFRVSIPKAAEHNLFRWRSFAMTLGLPAHEVEWFAEAAGGGDEHWYVYIKPIPSTWVRRLEYRPVAVLT